MTLEQTTQRILAAVVSADVAAAGAKDDAQDLAALEAASKLRQSAIAALASAPPTPMLRNAVAASIAAGEQARRAIRVIKQRMRNESRRLSNIETGFVRALRPLPAHRIDCKG